MLSLHEKIADKLINILCLDHACSIVVPSTVDANMPADTSNVLRKVTETMSRMFGGATCHAARGAWMSDVHGLISEDVVIVESLATEELLDSNVGNLIDLATWVRDELRQESVLITIDGKGYLID